MEHVDDVRAGARRDGGRDARLEVVGVDALERDLGAERLVGLGIDAWPAPRRRPARSRSSAGCAACALGVGRSAPRARTPSRPAAAAVAPAAFRNVRRRTGEGAAAPCCSGVCIVTVLLDLGSGCGWATGQCRDRFPVGGLDRRGMRRCVARHGQPLPTPLEPFEITEVPSGETWRSSNRLPRACQTAKPGRATGWPPAGARSRERIGARRGGVPFTFGEPRRGTMRGRTSNGHDRSGGDPPAPGLAAAEQDDGRRRRELWASYALLSPAGPPPRGRPRLPARVGDLDELHEPVAAQQDGPPRSSGSRTTALQFADPLFWRAALMTVAFAVVTSAAKLALGLGFALLLSRPFRGRALRLPRDLPAVGLPGQRERGRAGSGR